ncbi:MAG: hypothetical protein IJN68_01005 [Clostridia bacterium]|nr:hypothetical protein [Clostridia bacterium]
MEYRLKPDRKYAGLYTAVSLVFVVLSLFALYMSFQSGDMSKTVYALIYTAFSLLALFISYNNLVKCLTFNNINFTFDGKTYTYQQIERIDAHGGKYGRVFYKICIEGKMLYTFEKDYDGAKEFLYYLNFYNVPGTPRE